MREQVTRGLVQLGASIDTFRHLDGGGSVTPAAEAIDKSNVPDIALCLSLGANLSCAIRTAHSPPKVISGLEIAIGRAKPAVLVFLFDEIYTERPVRLGFDGVAAALVTLASRGSPAKACYEILESRGFDFKHLEEVICKPSDEHPYETSIADALLLFAEKSGASDLLRYLVKGLGLVSSARRMEGLKTSVDRVYEGAYGDRRVPPPRADMRKYKCAACEVVGATSF